MQDIEPFYNWRHIYTSEEDERSPFFGRTYSEFEFSQTVYNYYIHPQWDDFGSRTLYLKTLLADYDEKYAVIELIGEWNDAIENDIMELKREVLEKFMYEGITKFILIAENVLNFHSSNSDYYEELYDEPSSINKLFVGLTPLYGELFVTNVNAGFGLDVQYYLKDKADFHGQFRKTYSSQFFDQANAEAIVMVRPLQVLVVAGTN